MQIRPLNKLLFADDLAILFLLKGQLQEQLKLLENYCLDWGLEIKTEKAKVISFNEQGALLKTFKFYYDNLFTQYSFIPFEKNLKGIDNLINKER